MRRAQTMSKIASTFLMWLKSVRKFSRKNQGVSLEAKKIRKYPRSKFWMKRNVF